MHYDILNLLIDILVSTFVAAFVARFWVAARYKWDQSRKARNELEAFETWAKGEGYAWDRDLKGQYRSDLTRLLWEAFNAGTAL